MGDHRARRSTRFRLLFQAYGGGAFGPTAGGPGGGPGGGGGGGGGGGSGGVEGATYPPDSPYFPFGTRGVPVTGGTPTPVVNPAAPTGTNGARLPNPTAGESFVIALLLCGVGGGLRGKKPRRSGMQAQRGGKYNWRDVCIHPRERDL